MKKSKKLIMIIMILIVSFLIIAMGFDVKALDSDDFPIDLVPDEQAALTANQIYANSVYTNSVYANSVYANEMAANTQASLVQPNTNTNTESKLPQTGVTEDITVMFFIIVCVVSAIYAYTKIKNYNI